MSKKPKAPAVQGSCVENDHNFVQLNFYGVTPLKVFCTKCGQVREV